MHVNSGTVQQIGGTATEGLSDVVWLSDTLQKGWLWHSRQTRLVRIALLRLALVKLESLSTARSISTSERSAFCTEACLMKAQALHNPVQAMPAMQLDQDEDQECADACEEIAGATPHLKVCSSHHGLYEVGPLQLRVLEIAVAAVRCREVGPSQVLRVTP